MKTEKLYEWLDRAETGRGSAILLVAAVAQTLILSPINAAAAKMELTDQAITSAVQSELNFGMPDFRNLLDVRTSRGIVTLSGSADDILATRRPIQIAKSVCGVLGVIDYPSKRTSALIGVDSFIETCTGDRSVSTATGGLMSL